MLNRMTRQILVTGYSGRLGKLVATHLRDAHALNPRVLVRPARLAGDWQPPSGMDVAGGDYADPESLENALAGIDAVFLVSPVDPAMCTHELALAQVAARMDRPPHIVKISGLGTRLDSFIDSGRWHARIEQGIGKLNLPATFLRPNFFMQNLAFQADSIRLDGILRGAVADARIAMVDARDIAEVAASVLLGGSAIEGKAVSLTSERNYNYEEIADALSQAFNRPVAYLRQTKAEVAAALAKSGQPDWHVNILLAFNEAFIQGWGAEVTQVVAHSLGRPARLLESYLAELAGGARVSGSDPFPS